MDLQPEAVAPKPEPTPEPEPAPEPAPEPTPAPAPTGAKPWEVVRPMKMEDPKIWQRGQKRKP